MTETPKAPYSERPNRFPLPPVLFAGSLAFGYGLNLLLPTTLPAAGALKLIGALALSAGLLLVVWASSTLARHGTTILPHMASARLVTAGPFAWSRNPIYLGETAVIAGLGGVEASLGYLVAAAAFALLVTRLAILREEAHLAARFRDEWAAYAAKVRRWI